MAQAWIAPRGETTLALTFQRTELQGHFDEKGHHAPVGGTHSRALSLSIDHSLTDRLAISASIPYVSSSNGVDPQPILGRSGIDDGEFHSAWQDFRFGARYNVLSGPVVVTPSIGFRVPSHGYPTIGEAAVGPHLRETEVGLDLGRAFQPAGQMFYVNGKYSYTFVERFAGVSSNRSNIDVDLGYFVSPVLVVRGVVGWQDTYGGLTTDQIFSPHPPLRNPALSDALWFGHDRLLQDDHWRAGAGATYSVTSAVGVSLIATKFLSGTNSHSGYRYSVTVSRTFGSF